VISLFFLAENTAGEAPTVNFFIKQKEHQHLYTRNKKGSMPEEGSRAKLEKLYKKGRQSTEQN
jgi:hypothetical protein